MAELEQTISVALLGVIEKAVNAALRYDPASKNRLTELAGKIICVDSGPISVFLQPLEDGRLLLLSHWETEADATIAGQPFELLRLALANDKMSALRDSQINTKGDAAIIHTIQRVFAELEIDWEQALAERIGDVSAHLIGQQIRSGSRWSRDAGASMLQNIEEYLQEEGRQVPSKPEMDAAFREIDDLSLRTDRLEARIARIKAHFQAT